LILEGLDETLPNGTAEAELHKLDLIAKIRTRYWTLCERPSNVGHGLHPNEGGPPMIFRRFLVPKTAVPFYVPDKR
jgi:hypothetical protein